MIVHYQNTAIHFKRACETALLPDAEVIALDNPGACFDKLVNSGRDITVAINAGDLRKIWDYLKSSYIFVKAAGGLVRNDDGQLLLMVRNNRFDLPKGKVEPGETLAQAALRETGEETGLWNNTIGKLKLKTYHIYNLYGGWHFKQTSWFDMRHEGNASLSPQTEEGITQLMWADPAQWHQKLATSYSTMRYLSSQTLDL